MGPGTSPTHRYAIFLRGVNVNGITVRMAELRDELQELPLADVTTVLASGNVTCSSRLGPAELRTSVEEALRRRFGYPAWVIVVERSALAELAASVPPPPAADIHSYVTLFTGRPELDAFLAEAAHLVGQLTVLAGGTAVAWFSPKGQSTDVPISKLLARARYASTSTTRNLNTVHKVLRLLA